MKFFFVIACFFAVAFTVAKTSDEKILKQANAQILKANYQSAESLLEHVSADEKTSARYLHAACLVYDSLNEYDKAIASYEQLMQVAASADGVVDRINVLRSEKAKSDEKERVRLEKMKNCTKCKGSGYCMATVACDRCLAAGKVTKDCPRCQGQGKLYCVVCDGSGRVSIQDKSTGQTTVSTCQRCSGMGKQECPNMCNRGKFTDDCTRCLGFGRLDKKVACDQHP